MIGVFFWSFVFLRIPLSSIFEASYDSKRKFGLLYCQYTCLLSCRQQAYLELTLNLVELPYTVDPLEFCAQWASPKLYKNEVEKKGRYAFCMYLFCSSACCIVLSDFIHNINSKIKNY